MSSDFVIAIHALAYLRTHQRQVSSDELAKNICVNPVRVRKVMAALNKAGIIQTKTGLSGGYCFTIQEENITLDMLYEVLHIQIFRTAWRSGDPHTSCMISSGMSRIMDEVYADMEAQCRNYLKSKTIRDVIDELTSIQERKAEL